MKTILNPYLIQFVALVFLSGCSGGKDEAVKFPDKSPAEITLKYFDLLGDGGKLTSEAAFNMVSKKYGGVDPQEFRKYTEKYSRSKIKIIETILPEKANESGDWIASVKLEVGTPSMFDDAFKTTSDMHLILDKEAGEWKIDFFAQTIDETDHRKAPAEASAEPDKGNVK